MSGLFIAYISCFFLLLWQDAQHIAAWEKKALF